jgi:hypothetical protein
MSNEDLSVVRAGETLILGNGQQLELAGQQLDDAGLPPSSYARMEESGRFTGERIFLGNPRLYRAIVALLARGEPYRSIADICSVSVNTVTGIAFREKIPIETIRERLGRTGLDVAQLSLEAMKDLLSDPLQRAGLTLKELAVAFGVATQNAQLLLGGATARVENTQAAIPDHEAYLAFLKTVTPVLTGLRAGNPGPNAAAPGAPDGPALDLPASSEKTGS